MAALHSRSPVGVAKQYNTMVEMHLAYATDQYEREREGEEAMNTRELIDAVSMNGTDDSIWRPGETREECLARIIREAEERGARWALERHGNPFASKTLEQYAAEICGDARGI